MLADLNFTFPLEVLLLITIGLPPNSTTYTIKFPLKYISRMSSSVPKATH